MKKVLFISDKLECIESHILFLKKRGIHVAHITKFNSEEIYDYVCNSHVIISETFINGEDLGSFLPKYNTLEKKPILIGLCNSTYSYEALYALKTGASFVFNYNKSPKYLLAQIEALVRLSENFTSLFSAVNMNNLTTS